MTKSNDDFTTWMTIGFIVIVALVFFGVFATSWYSAGVQADVYRREGIELSQWEVFMGAKPAERTINMK